MFIPPVSRKEHVSGQFTNRHTSRGLLELQGLLVDKVALIMNNNVRVDGALLLTNVISRGITAARKCDTSKARIYGKNLCASARFTHDVDMRRLGSDRRR